MLLQSFPVTAQLHGGVEAMALQVGNAVPSLLAKQIGLRVKLMDEEARRAEQAEAWRLGRVEAPAAAYGP
jgi:hypothetical protein